MDNLGAMAGNEELLKKVASLEIENKSLKKGKISNLFLQRHLEDKKTWIIIYTHTHTLFCKFQSRMT